MKELRDANGPVDYLVRNPDFLRKIREVFFPFSDEPNKKRRCSRRKRSLEAEYHIQMPGYNEFSSFQDCLDLIRQRNSSGRCAEPVVTKTHLRAQKSWGVIGPRVRRRKQDGQQGCPDMGLLENGGSLLLRIDLGVTREQVLIQASVLYDVFSQTPRVRKFRRNQGGGLDDLAVWDEYLLEHNFARIARKHKVKATAVRQAYYRAFVRIMGEPYNPAKHSRKALAKEQIRRTCESCADSPSLGGRCQALCPPVKAYVDQDRRSFHYSSDQAVSVSSGESSSPACVYGRRHLLRLIALITGKTFDSIEEALDGLEVRDLARLKRDPRLRSEYL